jgi:dienelactone hydrolase
VKGGRVFITFCICVLAAVSVEASPLLWGDLPPGRFAVGFEVLQLPNGTPNQKPLQISIWYPAKAVGSAAMTYATYFLLSTTEQGKQPTAQEQETAEQEYKDRLASNSVPKTAIDQWFATSVAATRNAPPVSGRFPLVIVAQGNSQSADDQAILSEYIAGHGYVVATSPSPATVTPIKTAEDMLPVARRQALEMKLILNRLKKDPRVNADRIAVVAHSFGARSALLFSADENYVNAMVSLDGGIANKMGKEWIDKASDFDRKKFTAPLLHLYEDVDPYMSPDFDLLKTLRYSDRYLLKVVNLHHYQFASYGMASAMIPQLSQNQPDIKRKCEAVFRYTLEFLNAFVKEDPTARKFIEAPPKVNGYSDEDVAEEQIWRAQ